MSNGLWDQVVVRPEAVEILEPHFVRIQRILPVQPAPLPSTPLRYSEKVLDPARIILLNERPNPAAFPVARRYSRLQLRPAHALALRHLQLLMQNVDARHR